MKYLYTTILIILMTGCSAIYEVKPTYDASKIDRSCALTCHKEQKQCSNTCNKTKNTCIKESFNKAKKIMPLIKKDFEKTLSLYKDEKYDYLVELKKWERDHDDIENSYTYYDNRCTQNNTDSYECKKRDFYKNKIDELEKTKPIKPQSTSVPTFQEVLSDEQSKCDKDCGCQINYDNCFTSCGGIISYKKFCIENCPEEK